MSDVGIRVTTIFLNQIANSIGRVVTFPIGVLPEIRRHPGIDRDRDFDAGYGFKYTSQQSAIKRIRNGIKAELLALSLFKDSVAVNLLSQWRIVTAAFR